MSYEIARQFAQSWGLLYLVVVFAVVILFTFRPGTRKTAEEIAKIPLKED